MRKIVTVAPTADHVPIGVNKYNDIVYIPESLCKDGGLLEFAALVLILNIMSLV